MKKALILLSSLLLFTGLQIPIFARAEVMDINQTQVKVVNENNINWDKRKKMIEKVMVEAYSKRNENEVIRRLGELGVEYKGGNTQGPVSNSTSGNIVPLSYGSDVTLTYSYYRDRYSGNYLVQGAWSWNNTYSYDTNSNPYDAFGLWMNKQSYGTPASGEVFDSQGSAVYDTNGNLINNMWSSDFNPANAGVAWTISDVYTSGNYVGDYGQGWIWMTRTPSQSIYLRSKLVHTYQGEVYPTLV